jgi:hypothetical protein
MCGDPRIIGGDGVMFYFHGVKNQDFCLVSDSDLHINAHFIGTRPEGRFRDFTWVQALGFVFGPAKTLSIAAKPHVAHWDNSVDQLLFAYNGESFEIEQGEGQSWVSPDESVTLERIGATNTVFLRIKEKMGVALSVVPIGKKENDVHKYGVNTEEDCFAHFDMQFSFHNLSSSVNGVLGQTYQPGFVNPVKRGVAMPIMGGADRFFSSSLLSTDCRMSQYTATPVAAASAMASVRAICESSGLPTGVPGGITCRR